MSPKLITLERYVKVASGALYTFLIAKFLGSELYGVYSYNFALISLIGMFALNGLDSLFQKKLSEKNVKSNLFFEFFFIKFTCLTVALTIYVVFCFINNSNLSVLFYVFLPYIFTLPFSMIYQGLVYERKVKGIVVVSIINMSFSNLLRVYLFMNSNNIELFAASYVIEQLIYLVGYFYFYFDRDDFNLIQKKDIKPIFISSKSILKDAWALSLSAIMVGCFSRVTLFFLESNESMSEVGKYALILRVSDAMVILAASSSLIKMRELLDAKKMKICDYEKSLQNYKINMYFLSISSALIMFFSLYYLVPIVFGSEYVFSFLSCIYSSMIVLFNFVAIYTGRVLVVESFYKIAMIRNAIALLSLMTISYFFVPKLGIEGALISLSISWAISSFFILLFIKKTRHMVIPFHA
ncbi:hypothetical protein AB4581_15260 [Vibrio cyclitrophicus]|uniref:hypothetical protein n=1 Tax=Vibrio cyclitrophicus TaxID=47951 RepID=UPI0011B4F66E|nr:hypothetical protein [Vibrio cyclitrophicus]